MGRFLAIVVSLSVVAACGDNLVTQPGTHGQDGVDQGGNSPSVPRFVPEVCGVQTWTSTSIDPASDLSVVGRPDGATIMAVPQSGGPIFGFQVDTRMILRGSTDVVKVALDQSLSSIAGSIVDNRLVAAGVQDDAVFVDLLDNNLGNAQWIAKLPGSYVSDPSFFTADGTRVMPIATNSGLSLVEFDDSFEPINTKQIATSKPATALTAAQLGHAMVAAWSTPSDCHVSLINTFSVAHTTTIPTACPSPQIATDPVTNTGVLLFEGSDGIHLMHISGAQLGGDAQLVRPHATSPRVMFDGTRFWVSYLDVRGDLIVGFIDGDNQLVTTSLAGPRPQRAAYDLAVVNGQPWSFSLDASRFQAERMCITSVW